MYFEKVCRQGREQTGAKSLGAFFEGAESVVFFLIVA